MRVLFSGERHVHYGQIYVQSELVGMVELAENFTGQQNGLCGAVAPGSLYLITGLHTGNVGFTAEVYDSEPPADNAWQEIVEASFRPASPRTVLVEWGGDTRDLNLPRSTTGSGTALPGWTKAARPTPEWTASLSSTGISYSSGPANRLRTGW